MLKLSSKQHPRSRQSLGWMPYRPHPMRSGSCCPAQSLGSGGSRPEFMDEVNQRLDKHHSLLLKAAPVHG